MSNSITSNTVNTLNAINTIEQRIHNSVPTLEASLNQYWPAINPEKNGIPEIHLTMHLAHACLNHGWHIYPEAADQSAADDHNRNHQRIDLFVHGHRNIEGHPPEHPFTFLVECKKLYSAQQAESMHNDFQKMLSFQPVTDEIPRPEYAVLLAITVAPENAQWWKEPYPWDGGKWDNLMNTLQQCDRRSFLEFNARYRQYVLYAIKRINHRDCF